MNTDELTSRPHTSTVLDAGYVIADTTTNFDKTFQLGEQGSLRIRSHTGATKTLFTILYAASEKEIRNLSIEPSAEHMQQHSKLVDVVDLCITYCLGTSLLYQRNEATADMTVTNNFEQQLNERLVEEGKPTTHSVTITTSACISYHGTTTVRAIERTAKLADQCLQDVNKRDILNLYRDGKIRPHAAVECWYKIVEALKNGAGFKKLPESERKYLTSYPQIFRHHQFNKHRKRAEKGLKGNYSVELADPKKGMDTYMSYFRNLLGDYFR